MKDINNHKPAVDETVFAGISLETLASAKQSGPPPLPHSYTHDSDKHTDAVANIQSMESSPPHEALKDISYSELVKRYEALQERARARVCSLRGEIGRAADLSKKLEELLGRLKGWRDSLKTHEPAHVRPDDVEKQIEELKVRTQ